MIVQQCPREHEVVEAVAKGLLNETCSDDLRRHVASCAICKDVAEGAGALQNEYAAISQNVRVPSAGMVWWRAELRARREALRKAERPLTLAHAFGGACALGVTAALLSQVAPRLLEALPVLVQQHFALSLTVGVLLLAAPVAVYFVLSDK